MERNKKIVLTIISVVCVILLVYTLNWVKSEVSLFKKEIELYETEGIKELVERYQALIKERAVGTIGISAACLALITFNLLMWFNKPLFGIPLTPEQAAERKRVVAERKKAKLQEKLNKLN